jgi:hypothetical protein
VADPKIDCAYYLWMVGLSAAAVALAIYVGTRL